MIQREKRREKKANPPRQAKRSSQGKPVEFRLDAPAAEAVYLAGEFNGWDTQCLPMKKDKDGIWKATTKLPPGRYEYKLMAGQVWVEDLPDAERVMNPFGTQNFVIRVEQGLHRTLAQSAELSAIPLHRSILDIRPNWITGTLVIFYDPKEIDIMYHLKTLASSPKLQSILGTQRSN